MAHSILMARESSTPAETILATKAEVDAEVAQLKIVTNPNNPDFSMKNVRQQAYLVNRLNTLLHTSWALGKYIASWGV